MKHYGMRRFLILFLFFLLFSAGLNVYAEHASASIRPLAIVPFYMDGRIIIPIQVNGSEDLDVILDTGFTQQVLVLMHEETGEKLGLEYAATRNVLRGAGSGSNRAAHIVQGANVSLSGIDLGSLGIIVVAESRETSLHHNIGVIGGAVFTPYVVKIDFDGLKVSLYDPESFEPEEGWEEIPIILERNMPMIETTLSIDGTQEIPVRLIVDTGGKPNFMLSIDEEKQLEKPSRVVYSLSGTGLRGDVFADHGRIAGLKIGPYRLKDVISHFPGKEALPALEALQADGLIGLGCLYRFNMIFDYAHKRIFIKPNKFYGDPFEANMAGMEIRETVSGEHEVYYVMEDSEASRQGLRKGDVLEEVNGKETGTYSYLELKKIFEKDGKKVSVKIRRDGKSQKIKLKLKRFI